MAKISDESKLKILVKLLEISVKMGAADPVTRPRFLIK